MKPIFHWIDPKQLLNEIDNLAATLPHFRLVYVGFSLREYSCNRAEVIYLAELKISQNLSNRMNWEKYL